MNCVLPTTIDTPDNRAAMPDADPARWVRPVDLANVIVFLASDEARAIHGAAIPVAGLSCSVGVGLRPTRGHRPRPIAAPPLRCDTSASVSHARRIASRMNAAHPVTRVYLVEDSPILTKLLVGLLEAEPDVLVVGQADDAPRRQPRRSSSSRRTLSIIDLHLREGTGIDVLRAIRQHRRAPICIVLTNHSRLPIEKRRSKRARTISSTRASRFR